MAINQHGALNAANEIEKFPHFNPKAFIACYSVSLLVDSQLWEWIIWHRRLFKAKIKSHFFKLCLTFLDDSHIYFYLAEWPWRSPCSSPSSDIRKESNWFRCDSK
jgi:hypothetical protein